MSLPSLSQITLSESGNANYGMMNNIKLQSAVDGRDGSGL